MLSGSPSASPLKSTRSVWTPDDLSNSPDCLHMFPLSFQISKLLGGGGSVDEIKKNYVGVNLIKDTHLGQRLASHPSGLVPIFYFTNLSW